MTKEQFLSLLVQLADTDNYELRQNVAMRTHDTNNNPIPALDADGNLMIRDILRFGDSVLWIERDDNDPGEAQSMIDILENLWEFLPDICDALGAKPGFDERLAAVKDSLDELMNNE